MQPHTGLTLYSHIGLGAEILANVPPEVYAGLADRECKQAPNSVDQPARSLLQTERSCGIYNNNATDCSDDDIALFESSGCRSSLESNGYAWGRDCFFDGTPTAECVAAKAELEGYSAQCSLCIGTHNTCGSTQCRSECISGGSPCDRCMLVAGCHDGLLECAGFPGYVRELPERPEEGPLPGSPGDAAGEQYYRIPDDGEISFGKSITKAWDAGAYFIVLVVVLFSGVEPYVEMLLFLAAWFMPMTGKTRGKLLDWLTWAARWSMVDVVVVLFIVVGLEFPLEGGLIQIIARSAPAISAFAVQNIWAITQGEWITHLHDQKQMQQKGAIAQPNYHPMLQQLTQRGPFMALVILTWVLTLVGVVGPFTTFTVEGQDKEFSVLNLWDVLRDVDFPAIVVFMRCGVLPLLTVGGCLLVAGIGLRNEGLSPKMCHYLRILGNYCALDVLILGGLALGAEFGPLVVATAQSVAGCYTLSAGARIGYGLWCALGASLCQWLLVYVLGMVVVMHRAVNSHAKHSPDTEMQVLEQGIITRSKSNSNSRNVLVT